jgi:diguanylate cyclase (GGDEF)-like protein/PAS domain S-box-containing protein
VDLTPDFYRALLENLSEGVYFCDTERKIVFWNKGAEVLTGYKAEDVVGSHCYDDLLKHVDETGKNLCTDGCPLVETMRTGLPEEKLVFLQHRNGHRVPVLVRTMPVRDADGVLQGAVEVFSKQAFRQDMLLRIQELEQAALVDPLTRLVNRRHLEASLQTRLDELKRYGWHFGLLFIDIDHFKSINDQHGHEVGDKLLRLVAMTLSNSVRPFDLVGRWGGEEFVCLVVNVNEQQLLHVANRARSLVAQTSLKHNGVDLNVTISVGATLAVRGENVGSLIDRSDRLMYQSKAQGRNRITAEIPKATDGPGPA